MMFPVALSETFNVAYEITISDEELEILEVDDSEKVIVLLVLSRPGDENTGMRMHLKKSAREFVPTLIVCCCLMSKSGWPCRKYSKWYRNSP